MSREGQHQRVAPSHPIAPHSHTNKYFSVYLLYREEPEKKMISQGRARKTKLFLARISRIETYLIFVIFVTRAIFFGPKFYSLLFSVRYRFCTILYVSPLCLNLGAGSESSAFYMHESLLTMRSERSTFGVPGTLGCSSFASRRKWL